MCPLRIRDGQRFLDADLLNRTEGQDPSRPEAVERDGGPLRRGAGHGLPVLRGTRRDVADGRHRRHVAGIVVPPNGVAGGAGGFAGGGFARDSATARCRGLLEESRVRGVHSLRDDGVAHDGFTEEDLVKDAGAQVLTSPIGMVAVHAERRRAAGRSHPSRAYVERMGLVGYARALRVLEVEPRSRPVAPRRIGVGSMKRVADRDEARAQLRGDSPVGGGQTLVHRLLVNRLAGRGLVRSEPRIVAAIRPGLVHQNLGLRGVSLDIVEEVAGVGTIRGEVVTADARLLKGDEVPRLGAGSCFRLRFVAYRPSGSSGSSSCRCAFFQCRESVAPPMVAR